MRFLQKSERVEVYNKCNGRCAYCGCEISYEQMQVDHIIPRIHFIDHITNKDKVPHFLRHLTIADTDHMDNLNPACDVCNDWKKAFDLEFFRNKLSDQVNELNKRSKYYRIAKRYGLINENEIKIKFYFEQFKN